MPNCKNKSYKNQGISLLKKKVNLTKISQKNNLINILHLISSMNSMILSIMKKILCFLNMKKVVSLLVICGLYEHYKKHFIFHQIYVLVIYIYDILEL
jgi:hypothetical protein